MAEKFKYAPGMPGFGSKGDEGTDGLQGLSMYFTDFDADSESASITTRIVGNTTLRKSDLSSLPDGRTYVTGDLFFDSDGKAYEIDASDHTFTYKFANLNIGGLFVPLGVSSSEGYQRYFNSNVGQKYIVDNVYISSVIDYTSLPSTIYRISPADYTRIEYTNVKPDPSYNAFTVYATGGGDNQALALVYDEDEASFHLGNVDADGSVRNTNLVFDVSSLTVNRAPNSFVANSLTGNVLTNYEIAANSLFDPGFDPDPSSFVGVVRTPGGTADCSVYWNLLDFTNDPAVTGELCFYEYVDSYYGLSYGLDSSMLRPLVFSNLGSSGVVGIDRLKNSTYNFYMRLDKNGWTRRSDVKYVDTVLISVNPSSYNNEPSSAVSDIGFDVDSTKTWSYTVLSNPGYSFMTNIRQTGGTVGSTDGSVLVDITPNVYDPVYNRGTDRTGVIRIKDNGGSYKDVSIHQIGDVATVVMDVSEYARTASHEDAIGFHYIWSKEEILSQLKQTGLPAGTLTYVDVSMWISISRQNTSPTSYIEWQHDVNVRSPYYGGSLKGSLLLSERVEPDSVSVVDDYIHITNLHEGDFPLTIDVSHYAHFEDLDGKGSHGNFTSYVKEIRVYRKSGRDVSVCQTDEFIQSQLTVATPGGGGPL